jgi:hypothetical protein
MSRRVCQGLMCEPMDELLSSPLGRQYRRVYWLNQRRHGDRQVAIDQLEAHHRQPSSRIVAGDHAVRHTDPARSGQAATQRPTHHGLRFSDVGHQVHPMLTPRANDPEIDGHHQLAKQIRSDVDFIGAAVLTVWRDRLQFDREHRCCASGVIANHPCLGQGAHSRQPRWLYSLGGTRLLRIERAMGRIEGTRTRKPKYRRQGISNAIPLRLSQENCLSQELGG